MTTATEQLYKPFRVHGETITADHIKRVEWLLRCDRFTFGEVGCELVRVGVSYENHDRAADRLLQRARKLGLVVSMRGGWSTSPAGWAAIRDSDRSGEADETAQQAQPEARARAEGIAQPPQPIETPKDSDADPALVASPSSRQGVSTKGFDPGEGSGR